MIRAPVVRRLNVDAFGLFEVAENFSA